MSSPLVKVTVQGALLSGTSNIIAQALQAHNHNEPFVVQWRPVYHWCLFQMFMAPINYIWGEFMESLLPATHLVPTEAGLQAAAKDPAALATHPSSPGTAKGSSKKDALPLTTPKLSLRNTVLKVIQEQTLSALFNTISFLLFFAALEGQSWDEAWLHARAQAWPLMLAGWRMWPLVSIVNLAFVQNLQLRALIGSMAGLVWSVYLGLIQNSR